MRESKNSFCEWSRVLTGLNLLIILKEGKYFLFLKQNPYLRRILEIPSISVVSYSSCSSPQLDQVQESAHPQKIKTIGERFMVKEESAVSVGTRPWTPEGRSLTLSIAFML
ncbi:hypothetical protein AVEN_212959-1 [Araneus ventricosus]|uniref:Uncharacterized protein n=1 Tax=Araneus ventricosus TaxID=182803 RepID=A0A4Y2R5B6_ARAVE|nr:hypothetical protein AVEN_212959-1 [Araneus ventricosus]